MIKFPEGSHCSFWGWWDNCCKWADQVTPPAACGPCGGDYVHWGRTPPAWSFERCLCWCCASWGSGGGENAPSPRRKTSGEVWYYRPPRYGPGGKGGDRWGFFPPLPPFPSILPDYFITKNSKDSTSISFPVPQTIIYGYKSLVPLSKPIGPIVGWVAAAMIGGYGAWLCREEINIWCTTGQTDPPESTGKGSAEYEYYKDTLACCCTNYGVCSAIALALGGLILLGGFIFGSPAAWPGYVRLSGWVSSGSDLFCLHLLINCLDKAQAKRIKAGPAPVPQLG